MHIRWSLTLIALTGCQDLAKLETEQAALEAEVAVLRDNVETMRKQMKRAGMVKAGPANLAATVGHTEPANDLADALPWSASRAGTPPSLPALEPERRGKTACGYRLGVGWLEPISDLALANTGAGKASPLRLALGGTPLTPHAGPPQFEKSCGGAFRHQGKYLFFSPPESVDAVGSPELSLATDAPTPREDGKGTLWVYPGTTLTLTFDAGWDPAWGDLQIDLDARVLAVGTADDPNPSAPASATASVLGEQSSSNATRLGIQARPEPPTGPWTLEIRSPANGGFVLVETLTVGNADHALVVAAGGTTP